MKHKKSLLFLRHGARAPTGPALKHFLENPTIENVWKKDDGELYLDQLTQVGKDQSTAVGRFMRSYYEESFGTEQPLKIKWKSSIVGRAVETGEAFWRGFFHDNEEAQSVNIALEDKEERERIFRPWLHHVQYNQWLKENKSSNKEVLEHSSNYQEKIVEILQYLEIHEKLKGLNGPSSFLLITSVKELYECEKFYEFQLLLDSGGNGESGDNNTFTKTFPFLQLPEHFVKIVDEISLHVWNLRFFNHPFTLSVAEYTLKELHAEIFNDTENESDNDDTKFELFSGHDYTILTLLAGLKVPSYPEFLSFSCYLVIDVFDSEDGERLFTVTLNSAPFETESSKVIGEVQTSRVQRIKNHNSGDGHYFRASDLSI